MSALAQFLRAAGHDVSGSDRAIDQGNAEHIAGTLRQQGILLFSQDGAGITDTIDVVVTSTAVEADIPDLAAAREAGLTIRHRSEVLADLVNSRRSVAVAGTSGKSTVTGLIGTALTLAGRDPGVINGGRILNFISSSSLGNSRYGEGPLVVEADESDGTVERYEPEVGVILNLSRDHQDVEETLPLFQAFAQRTRRVLIVPEALREQLVTPDTTAKVVTFGWEDADVQGYGLEDEGWQVRFRVGDDAIVLRHPGRHNADNGLAALAAAESMSLRRRDFALYASGFRGVHRRLERVGEVGGITVLDDYAHNPDKVTALLAALTARFPRLHLIFQWHGYGPARFLGEDMAGVFAKALREGDVLHVPPVFYAGGTTTKDDSAERFAKGVRNGGRAAFLYASRDDAITAACDEAQAGDAIVFVGARDGTLSNAARSAVERLG